MAWFVVRKLLGMVATMVVTSFLVFASLYVAPGDPLDFLLQGRSPTPEMVAAVSAQYGLDDPFLAQYWHWLVGVLHLDFGRSLQYREEVAHLISARVPTTLGLIAMSGTIICVVGLAVGIVGAVSAGRVLDKALLILSTVLAAIPSFVAAIILISVFSVRLGWFPTSGAGEGLGDRIYHLFLPAVALSLTFIALVSRVTRSSMLDELGREHVEVAISRGMTKRSVIRRHVLRNALGPILTITGLLVAGLLVASAVVETAFSLNGMGSLLVQSVDKQDFAIVQAIVLLVVFAFVVVNTVVDIAYPFIDPRVKAGRSAR
jgi:peptide/nickel transport system permease protein